MNLNSFFAGNLKCSFKEIAFELFFIMFIDELLANSKKSSERRVYQTTISLSSLFTPFHLSFLLWCKKVKSFRIFW